jgi:hypothetical protein
MMHLKILSVMIVRSKQLRENKDTGDYFLQKGIFQLIVRKIVQRGGVYGKE